MVSLHLAATCRDDDDFSTVFQYKVVNGPVAVTHYGELVDDPADTGLELAKLAALPKIVLDRAKVVSYRLSEMEDLGEYLDDLSLR